MSEPIGDFRRCFVETRLGTMHHVEVGTGRPVVLLHQTPRSWREFEWVLPHLTGFRRLAVDMPGFGESCPPAEWTIEALADGVIAWADGVGLDEFALVGHHTGGVVAYEVASRLGPRVSELVLSCISFSTGEPVGPGAEGRAVLDDATPSADGSHLLRLWADRIPYYPENGRTELLQRTVADTLRAVAPEQGHLAVAGYTMLGKQDDIAGRVLYLTGDQDPSWPHRDKLPAALPRAVVVELPGGGVALPEQAPFEFATCVREFLQAAPR